MISMMPSGDTATPTNHISILDPCIYARIGCLYIHPTTSPLMFLQILRLQIVPIQARGLYAYILNILIMYEPLSLVRGVKFSRKRTILAAAVVLVVVMLSPYVFQRLYRSPPTASIRADKTVVDIGEPVTFYIDDSFGAYAIIDFHDGESVEIHDFSRPIVHSFEHPGKYLVTLRVVSSENLDAIDTVEITVSNDPPDAILTIEGGYSDGRYVCVGEDEELNISVIGEDDEWDIDSLKYLILTGDGRNFSANTISISYPDAGIYPVTAWVWDDQGAGDYEVALVKVVNTPPRAGFSVTGGIISGGVVYVEEGRTLVFNASETVDTPSDMEDLAYYWNISGIAYLEGPVVEYKFTRSGVYRVDLVVIDDDGGRSRASATINVTNEPPRCVLHVEREGLYEGETYIFRAIAEDTWTDMPLLDYWWSIGGSGWRRSSIFTDDGEYNVSVFVFDEDGEEASSSEVFVVENKPPVAGFYALYVDANLTFRIIGDLWLEASLVVYADGEEYLNMTLAGNRTCITRRAMFALGRNYSFEVLYVPKPEFMENLSMAWNSSRSGYGAWDSRLYRGLSWDVAVITIEYKDGVVNLTHKFALPNYTLHCRQRYVFQLDVPMQYSCRLTKTMDYYYSRYGGEEDIYFNVIHTLNQDNRDGAFYMCTYYANTIIRIVDNGETKVSFLEEDILDIDRITEPSWWAGWRAFMNMQHLDDGENMTLMAELNDTLEWNITSNNTMHVWEYLMLNITTNISRLYWSFNLWDVMDEYTVSAIAYIFDQGNDSVHVEIMLNGTTILSKDLTPNGYFLYSNVSIDIPVSGWKMANIRLHAVDDDGAEFTTTVEVSRNNGDITVSGIVPYARIRARENVTEGEYITFRCIVVQYHDVGQYNISWIFGDGETATGDSAGHTFTVEGIYLVRAYIETSQGTFVAPLLIRVENPPPYITPTGPYAILEGETISLSATVQDTWNDENNITTYWVIEGVGIFPGRNNRITIYQDGAYRVSVVAIDDNGARDILTTYIKASNEPPEIEVRNSPSILEGTTDIYRIEIYDTIPDRIVARVEYWISQEHGYGRTVPICMDDGDYTLQIVAWDDDESVVELHTVRVIDQSPILVPESRLYKKYGERGEITVKVHVIDTYLDFPTSSYTWSYSGVQVVDVEYGETTVSFKIYTDRTTVEVATITLEDTIHRTVTIYMDCFIDSDGDGLSDEYEEMLSTSPYGADSDNDYITDYWEVYIVGTDPSDPDTDNDGIPDGYSEELGTGELYMDTDPLNPDTDGDGLEDGVEFFGWTIKVNVKDIGEIEYNVTSDPRIEDSDGDRLSDYWEYMNGTDPMNNDTDNDGLLDVEEIVIGTSPLHWDTDGDGLADGEEFTEGFRGSYGGIYHLMPSIFVDSRENPYRISEYRSWSVRLMRGERIGSCNIRNVSVPVFKNYTGYRFKVGYSISISGFTTLGLYYWYAEAYIDCEVRIVVKDGNRIIAEKTKMINGTIASQYEHRFITKIEVPKDKLSGIKWEMSPKSNTKLHPGGLAPISLLEGTFGISFTIPQTKTYTFEIHTEANITWTNVTYIVARGAGIHPHPPPWEEPRGIVSIRIFSRVDAHVEIWRRNLISNPLTPDSDNDGLTDLEEIHPGQDGHITDPWIPDTDGDGLNDSQEYTQLVYSIERESIEAGWVLDGVLIDDTVILYPKDTWSVFEIEVPDRPYTVVEKNVTISLVAWNLTTCIKHLGDYFRTIVDGVLKAVETELKWRMIIYLVSNPSYLQQVNMSRVIEEIVEQRDQILTDIKNIIAAFSIFYGRPKPIHIIIYHNGQKIWENTTENTTINININLTTTPKGTWEIEVRAPPVSILTPLPINMHSIIMQRIQEVIQQEDIDDEVKQKIMETAQDIVQKALRDQHLKEYRPIESPKTSVMLAGISIPTRYIITNATRPAAKIVTMGVLESATISFQHPLNPTKNDVDEDGIPDGTEQMALNGWPTNPLEKDTDGDGIPDRREILFLKNPLTEDTDHDGTPDPKDLAPTANRILMVNISTINTTIETNPTGNENREIVKAYLVLAAATTNAYVLELEADDGGEYYVLYPERSVVMIDIPDDRMQEYLFISIIIVTTYNTTLPLVVTRGFTIIHNDKEQYVADIGEAVEIVREKLKNAEGAIMMEIPCTGRSVNLGHASLTISAWTQDLEKTETWVIVEPNTTITTRLLEQQNYYLVYIQDKNTDTTTTVLVPENIWANNWLASKIMKGETGELPQEIMNANITAITREQPTKIQAIVGIETTDKNKTIQLLTLNATGNKTYGARRLDIREILMLSTTPEVYKAIPYQRPEETRTTPARSIERRQARQIDIDWDEVEEYFEELGNEIAETVTEVYRSVVNTLSSSLDAIVDALQGVYGMVMEGVRMVMGGLMAAAGFLSKLFRDLMTLLMDLGQKLLGAIMEALEWILDVLKNYVLYWMSWVWAKAYELTLYIVSAALSVAVEELEIQQLCSVEGDMPLHIIIGLDELGMDGTITAYSTVRHVDILDCDLWCIVSDVRAVINGSTIFHLYHVDTLGVTIDWSLYPKPETKTRGMSNSDTLVGNGSFSFRSDVGYFLEHVKDFPTFTNKMSSFIGNTSEFYITVSITSALVARVFSAGFSSAFSYAGDVALAILGIWVYVVSEKYFHPLIDMAVKYGYLAALKVLRMVMNGLIYGLGLATLLLWGGVFGGQQVEAAIGIVALALGIQDLYKIFEFEFSTATVAKGVGFTVGGIQDLICLIFNDSDERECYMERGWGGAMLLALVMMLASLYAMRGEVDAAISLVESTTDLEPPGIDFTPSRDMWTDGEKLCFSYVVSDEEHGRSQIYATVVGLFRTPRDGDALLSEYNPFGGKLKDDISGLDYEIEIPLANMDGVWGTEDDDGLIDITQATGVKVNPVDGELDDVTEEIKGYANFTGVKIHTECRYYMVVVAVDLYGNAYWEIYDVTDLVHSLVSGSESSRRSTTKPKVAPINLRGRLEPRGFTSHYYTLNGEPYIPWIKRGNEYQRCLTFVVLTGGRDASISAIGVEADGDACGFGVFILRPYGLWRYGHIEIVVEDGYRFTIIFVHTIGWDTYLVLVLATAMLLPLSGWIRRRLRCGGRRD